jgi:hypothetical protein
MTKAAIVIGVNKTGDLPVLKDASAGAGRVAKWLVSEGYQTEPLLDEEAPGSGNPSKRRPFSTRWGRCCRLERANSS